MPSNRIRPMVLLAVVLAIVSSLLAADETKSQTKSEPWKIEDIIYDESVSDFHISPDARWVVWTKGEGDKEKDARVSNLFLSSLTEDREIQLTRGADNSRLPRWSPDGEWIAFISGKPRPQAKPDTAPVQIWMISSHGGEPYPLTELARVPRLLDWLDKDTVIFSAEEDPTACEQALKKKQDDSEIVDDADHAPPVRLFKVSVKDKKITRLTNNTDWIQDWSVSRDGKYAVAVHAKSLHYIFDQKTPPLTILHNLTDGTEKQVFAEGRILPAALRWATDNSGFYTIAPFSNDPKFLTATIEQLYFYDLASAKHTQVPLYWENGLARALQPTRDGFYALLAAGYHFKLAHYTREKAGESWAWKRALLEGDRSQNVTAFDVTEDGKTLVYDYSTASSLPQLFRAQVDSDKFASSVQLTKLNEKLAKSRSFSKTEVVRWKAQTTKKWKAFSFTRILTTLRKNIP
jgi:dipeptidyl aminopeptidase/acylaminoacyl peptidase